MGNFDTFRKGHIEVQSYHFGKNLRVFNINDRVNKESSNIIVELPIFPPNKQNFKTIKDTVFIVIKNGIFIDMCKELNQAKAKLKNLSYRFFKDC